MTHHKEHSVIQWDECALNSMNSKHNWSCVIEKWNQGDPKIYDLRRILQKVNEYGGYGELKCLNDRPIKRAVEQERNDG